jgi:hypothetical protein
MKVMMLTLSLVALIAEASPAQSPSSIFPLPIPRARFASQPRANEQLPAPLSSKPAKPKTEELRIVADSPYSAIHYDLTPASPVKLPKVAPATTSEQNSTSTLPYRASSRQGRQRPQYLPPSSEGSSGKD